MVRKKNQRVADAREIREEVCAWAGACPLGASPLCFRGGPRTQLRKSVFLGSSSPVVQGFQTSSCREKRILPCSE